MNKEQSLLLRRSASTLLAAAVLDLFPDVLLVGGGENDIGFYYDFIFSQIPLDSAEELIEIKMKSLVKEGLEVRSFSMMRENAEQLFLHHNQPLLAAEALEEDSNILSLVQIGPCYDLSEAPHIATTGELKAIKLIDRERFDEGDAVVIRFIGAVYPELKALKDFYKAYERYKKKNYPALGIELQLYSWDDENDCYWHPKGEILKQLLLASWKKEGESSDSLLISTPISSSQSLFLEHIKLYKSQLSSSSYLPLRLIELRPQFNADFEKESSLFQLEYNTTDQMTTICSEEQLMQEFISSLQFIEKSIRIFDLKVHRYLVASRPSAGFVHALEQCELPYDLEKPPINGEGFSFEWRIEDLLGREWTGPSVKYVKLSGGRYALGRTLYSSLESFIGLLLEKYEGVFPFWLAPEQVRILAVGMKSRDYADTVLRECKSRGIRVQCDYSDITLGAKIHRADIERIPYVLIIGDKEKNQGCLTVRSLKRKQEMKMESFAGFFENILNGDE